MSSEYHDKRLLGVLEGISESLEDIALHLRTLAKARDFFVPSLREDDAECEPCIDMEHQKGYE